MLYLLLAGLVLAGLVNFACSILILRDLNAAGVKVGFYELRWQIHRHLKTYRALCRDGRSGSFGAYYGYLVSLLLLLVFVLLLLSWGLERA